MAGQPDVARCDHGLQTIIQKFVTMPVKHLLTAVACMAFLSTLEAQLSVGISSGATFGHLYWKLKTPSVTSNSTLDLQARFAIPAEYQFSSAFSVRAEAALQRRPQAVELVTLSGVSVDASQVFQSVEVSVLGVFRPFRSARNLYFMGGPAVSYLQGRWLYAGAAAREKDPELQRRTRGTDPFQGWSRIWILADAGLGYAYPLGAKGRLFAEARFQTTLTNLLESTNASIRFWNVVGNVGYMHSL